MDQTCPAQAAQQVFPSAPARGWRAWVVPDIGALLSILTVVWCVLFFDGTQELFRDSDSGWHIRNGEAILEGRGLPRFDPYSLTRSGQPWFAWEWGVDVLMGAAHKTGGLAWVAGLYCIVLGLCTWLWFRLTWLTGGHFLTACALSIPLLTTSNIHWHARPHVFSWLFLLGTVVYFERERRSLWVVALIGLFWSNLHPSFFLLAVFALIYAFSRLLEPFVWSGFDRARAFSEARWFVLAAVAGMAGSLVNPYGFEVHRHVFAYLGNQDLLSRIGEFQTFNFHTEGAWQLIATMGLCALGGGAALAARRPAHFILIAMLLAMGLRSARALPLVAMVTLPLANGAITWVLREWTGLQPSLRARIDGFLRYGDNLRRLELGFTGAVPALVAVVALALLLSRPGIASRAGFPPDQFPVAAAAKVAGLPPDARIFSSDSFGGYLIYRFSGQRKVYFDGRSDFYGVEFMKDYLKLIEVRPGWRELLKRDRFTHALLANRYSLVAVLESEGWTRLYSDKVATLLAAPPGKD